MAYKSYLWIWLCFFVCFFPIMILQKSNKKGFEQGFETDDNTCWIAKLAMSIFIRSKVSIIPNKKKLCFRIIQIKLGFKTRKFHYCYLYKLLFIIHTFLEFFLHFCEFQSWKGNVKEKNASLKMNHLLKWRKKYKNVWIMNENV